MAKRQATTLLPMLFAAGIMLAPASAALAFTGTLGGTGAIQTVHSVDAALDRLKQGDAAGAIALLSNVLAEGNLPSSKEAVVHYDRAMAYVAEGNKDNAIADFSTVIAQTPRYRPAYIALANVYCSEGNYAKSIDVLKGAVRVDAGNADAFTNLGNIYHLEKQDDGALKAYNAAIAAEPSAYAYEGRGLIYLLKGDAAKAEADLSEAIKLKPDYLEAYVNRGMAYANLGAGKLAISDLDQVLEINPSDIDVQIDRANVYALLGQPDLAIPDYTAAIRAKPADAVLYRSRGDAYLSQDIYVRAIADYNSALGRNPSDVVALANRGAAFYATGKYGNAVSDYKAAVRLSPRDANLFDDLGNAYGAQGRLNEAIAAFDQALNIQPANSNAIRDRDGAMKAKRTGEKIFMRDAS